MERQAITVRGVVQGVGFRPFVYGLASQLRLSGFVQNRAGSVHIEVEGDRTSLCRFMEQLHAEAPPLARIEAMEWQARPTLRETGFRIESSSQGQPDEIFISPDVSPCADCLAELFDPTNRRYEYPFLNCTHCGPRLTIIEGAPYDRERTTMARFEMCPECRAEYDDPTDRRFHAQPTACATCGPRLELLDAAGESLTGSDPLSSFANALLRRQIGAMKGLGGFHLVCDARDEQTVRLLRQRKHRDEKPFAVMVPDTATACRLCELSRNEIALLQSPRRPIVLLRRRLDRSGGASPGSVCDAVAPDNPNLGLMLPYTPLHYLLMKTVCKIPLVMTSGNRSDEPIAYENDDAVVRLGQIADLFLVHDRPIHVRCDDSVTRIVEGVELPVRRSRGYAPEALRLPFEVPRPLLAVGGQLKGVFAVGHGRQAILSHHLGDLDHFAAFQAFERDIGLYEEMFEIEPRVLVHDLHPDYVSTGYALRRATDAGLETITVQHHHAHMASCMAENDLNGPIIGVSLDGTGYGTDGQIWGGEFLTGDYATFSRAVHLRYVAMPGGDKAAREPWRMALSHALDAGCAPDSVRGIQPKERYTVMQMIQRGVHAPLTSSAGRLFDAVAALAGVRTHNSYEGQAAIELEWLASTTPAGGTYPFELSDTVDTRPLIREIVKEVQRGVPAAVIARRFHSTMVAIITAACHHIRNERQLDRVALSGGVFLNVLLTRETCTRLRADGFHVYRHRRVPPGDGGLSLGQLAVAAARLADRPSAQMFEHATASIGCGH